MNLISRLLWMTTFASILTSACQPAMTESAPTAFLPTSEPLPIPSETPVPTPVAPESTPTPIPLVPNFS
ncbi:MAG: hypothetical protein HYZ23_01055, partial [Chloroflexi bacterium]|nr:hypothetical protein [Chloroflexota bacterium]